MFGTEKNYHILRLAAYLVEIKVFRSVEFIFYVRGHAKNACDRLFNQINIRVHNDQVPSYRCGHWKLIIMMRHYECEDG
jgi:hypothetical protein